MALKLNQNHWAALVFGIFGWVLGWYSLVLVTASISNPNEQKFPLKPTKRSIPPDWSSSNPADSSRYKNRAPR